MKNLVGFGRTCITPTESVPLAGYGATSKRMSQSVASDLYTTCVAFTDEAGQTLLAVTNDLILASDSWTTPAREKMSQATGVPVEHILVSCTHTHSGPDMGNLNHQSILDYRQIICDLMAQAAVEAMADRKAAQLYYGTTQIERVNFVRHYVLDNGSYIGDNFGDASSGKILRPTTEADRCMQLVRCVREEGEDVILCNWQTHPHRDGGGKKTEITADLVGAMRQNMEERLGCKFAYFSGAGGNINSRSRIREDNLPGDAAVCGAYMAYHAIACLPKLQPLEGGAVRVCNRSFTADTDHTMDHLAEIGHQLRMEWERTGDHLACREAGKPYGIHSPYHAGAIYSKSKAPLTRQVPMITASVGKLSFVGAPYEMFDTNGTQIKRGSPFTATFVCTCCNDYVGYIPSAYGYQHGCYEADCTPIAPGTGEKLAIEYIDMLASLYRG